MQYYREDCFRTSENFQIITRFSRTGQRTRSQRKRWRWRTGKYKTRKYRTGSICI